MVTTAEDAAFMADLLCEVDHNSAVRKDSPPVKRMKSDAKRKVRILSPPLLNAKHRQKPALADEGYLPETPPAETRLAEDDDDDMRLVSDVDEVGLLQNSSTLPSSPTAMAVERRGLPSKANEDDVDDLMEVAPVLGHSGMTSASVNISASRPSRSLKKAAYPSPESSSPPRPAPEAIDASAWNDVTTKLNVLSSPATETVAHGKLRPQDVLEEDGGLRMFWLDYTEVNGSLCLFGKIKNKNSGKYVSCFVKVDNILRKLYFLPRERRHRQYPVPDRPEH